jgi:hypothetical protein
MLEGLAATFANATSQGQGTATGNCSAVAPRNIMHRQGSHLRSRQVVNSSDSFVNPAVQVQMAYVMTDITIIDTADRLL